VFAEASDGLAFVLLPVPTGAGPARDPRSGDPADRAPAREGGRRGANDTDDADLPPDLFAQVQAEAATTWRNGGACQK
jgi:hypothetical protein